MNQLALVQILLVVSLPTWIIAMNFCSYDIRIHECDVTSETSLLLEVATLFLLPKGCQAAPRKALSTAPFV